MDFGQFLFQGIIFDRERIGDFIENEVFLTSFLMVKPENLCRSKISLFWVENGAP
jgi:hypothetical protein